MLELRTQQELINFFHSVNTPLRAKVVTRTPVKMNKKDVATKTIANTLGDIYKVQTIEVDLNADYEGTVNNHRLFENKQQDFKAEDLTWGRHVNGAVIEHEGQLYLKTIEVSKIGPCVYETASGTQINYSEFAAFVPQYGGAVKQKLDDEVKVRTFKLSNVIGFNVDGKVRFVGQ